MKHPGWNDSCWSKFETSGRFSRIESSYQELCLLQRGRGDMTTDGDYKLWGLGVKLST